jgi:hypothetical protein
MAAKRGPQTYGWHPSLDKVFKGVERWWQSHMVEQDVREEEFARLRSDLAKQGAFITDASTIRLIALSFESETCLLSAQGRWEDVSESLQSAVAWRALDFRSLAGRSLPAPKQPVRALQSSMQAVGPTMLSQWELGKTCAEQLIAVAHKDQRLNGPVHRRQYWGKGTNDAFLIFLLSRAYDLRADYTPANPLIAPYQALLDGWRTTDEAVFQEAMAAAAEFHIGQSYYGGAGKQDFEFESSLDIVYPGELLAVQALRRRDGLPEFEAGHELIDTPWRIVRDLAPCTRPPLTIEVEARLGRDFPSFR